jgi:two-component system NarL family sensor kinase
MKRSSIILSAFLSFYTFCSAQFIPLAQKRYTDSLEALLSSNTTDSIKASATFNLTLFWLKTDTIKAKLYAEKAKVFARKSPYMQAIAQYVEGTLYEKTDAPKAKKIFLKSDSLLAEINTKSSYTARCQIWHAYARILQLENDAKGTLKIFIEKIIPYAKKGGNKTYIGTSYINVGTLLTNVKEYKRAESYFKEGIVILKSAPAAETSLIYAYISIGRNYLGSQNLTRLRDMLDKLRPVLKNYPISRYYLDYYELESGYFNANKNYQKAIESTEKGIAMAEKLNMGIKRDNLIYQKYNVLTKIGKHKEAKATMLLIINNNNFVLVDDRFEHYKNMAETNQKLGNMNEAYMWLDKYSRLKDSLTNSKTKEDMNALEIKFRTAESQKKIIELNAENEKVNLSAKNSHLLNWLLGTATLLILSALIFGLYYYHNQKKLADQKEQIRLTNAMLQGQETERYRVARDLHDGLGNMLAVVKFNLWQFAKEKPAAELDEIIHHLDHSVNELRRIAHDMMPEMLLNIGLEAALKDLCESLSSDELEVDCQFINIKNTIPQPTQVAIYRIVQELLTNVVKHAQAKNVFLQCTQNKQFFFITLEDDGKGFDANLQNEKTGIGLSNIKSRVAYLNGKMEIISKPNQPGTSINIELNVKA